MINLGGYSLNASRAYINPACACLIALGWLTLGVVPHTTAQTPTPTPPNPTQSAVPASPTSTTSPASSASSPAPATTTMATPPATNSDNVNRRIERARALAVVGQGVTAARELEAVRVATTADKSNPVRGIAGVLLMGLYVEQADYRRARNLLDEAAAARIGTDETSSGDDAARTYFAIAGQLLNGVRGRLERYRAYHVAVAGGDVPAEATGDVEGMRDLLDALVRQARAVRGTAASTGAQTNSSSASNADLAALFEDAVGMRMNLARSAQERTTWQRELADARQQLAAVELRLQPNRQASTRATSPSAATPTVSNAARAATQTAQPTINSASATTNSTSTSDASSAPASPDTAAPPTTTIAADDATTPPATVISTTNAATSANDSANTSNESNPPSESNSSGATPRRAAESPLEVGSLSDRATQRIAPSYPTTARTARVGGTVTVFLVVNEQGNVIEVRRAAGPQLLRRAAEDAARRWKFRPVVIGGQPVRAIGYISFNFTL